MPMHDKSCRCRVFGRQMKTTRSGQGERLRQIGHHSSQAPCTQNVFHRAHQTRWLGLDTEQPP